MDGNRRCAQQRRIRTVEGHSYGYSKLIDALEWCMELGVRCVSVYAFSIDNYKRSIEEVETLMTLAQDKLVHMVQEHDVLERHGVQVRVVGDVSLAPPAVQAAAQRVMAATAHHSRAVLNICFSYTASEEMLRALGSGCGWEAFASAEAANDAAARSVNRLGSPSSSSGSNNNAGTYDPVAAVDSRLYTAGCPPVDLLVRTSGETRLSDFMLWQCRHALLVFASVLWPDFSLADLASAILQFQAAAGTLARLREAAGTQEQQAHAAAAAAVSWSEQQHESQHEHDPRRQPQLDSGSVPSPLLQAVKTRLLLGQEQEEQRWHALECAKAAGAQCSPRAVASPDEPPSSPSSRSDGSAELLALPLDCGDAQLRCRRTGATPLGVM